MMRWLNIRINWTWRSSSDCGQVGVNILSFGIKRSDGLIMSIAVNRWFRSVNQWRLILINRRTYCDVHHRLHAIIIWVLHSIFVLRCATKMMEVFAFRENGIECVNVNIISVAILMVLMYWKRSDWRVLGLSRNASHGFNLLMNVALIL